MTIPHKSNSTDKINDSYGTISILECMLEKEKAKNIELSNRIVILEDIIRKKFKNIEEISIHVEPDKR